MYDDLVAVLNVFKKVEEAMRVTYPPPADMQPNARYGAMSLANDIPGLDALATRLGVQPLGDGYTVMVVCSTGGGMTVVPSKQYDLIALLAAAIARLGE